MEELVLRHESRLFRTAVAIMGNRADAEDIVQEAFLKVVEKQPAFQSAEHETAWLIRVTNPAQTQDQRSLIETIMSLPPKYRTAIHLFYYEGYSTREIAEITGQKEPTVRSLLTRARHKLKVVLEEETP